MRVVRPSRRTALRGGFAGAALGVVAAGVAVQRYAVGRLRLEHDPEGAEPLGALTGRPRTVTASDGLELHVEEAGNDASPLTIVFVHGYLLSMASWHYQRRDLDDLGRLVFIDQRGHGRSGRSAPESCTIDQLGDDLYAVLQAVAPTGPVILVGHSMGGMTVMALADAHPELFGPRVVGVALVSTSSGRLAEVTFGLPALIVQVGRRLLPRLQPELRRRAAVLESGRRLGADVAFLVTRRYGFGSRDVSPALVEFVERMTAATPVEVISDFYATMTAHDKLSALPVLAGVETLVLVGANDLVTPADHSRTIAAELPGSELVVLDGAGHQVILERAALVNRHLRAFIGRAGDRYDDVAAAPVRTASGGGG